MTHLEQEERLRRALHAAAESIEPAADGLERIRARLARPRPLAVAWLMAGWTDLAQPAMLRIEQVWAKLAELLGVWLRPVGSLWASGAERLRPAIDRMRPAIDRMRPALRRLLPTIPQPGAESASRTPRYPWLRLAAAIGVIVMVAFVGGFALTGLPHTIISQVAQAIAPSDGNGSGGTGHAPAVAGTGTPANSPSSGQHRASPSPNPSCSSSPKATQGANPAPTPTVSPSTPSPTQPAPTPTPTTPTPTPTPTSTGGATSPAPTSGLISVTALLVADGFQTGGPQQGTKPSPTPTPSC